LSRNLITDCGLAPAVVTRPSSWLNTIDSFHSLVHAEGAAQVINQSLYAAPPSMVVHLGNELRISSPHIDSFKASVLGIESNFAKISATSIMAESALSSFRWHDLGNQIDIRQPARAILSDSFLAVSESYRDVFQSIQATPQSIIDLDPFIVKRTPVEYYTGAEFCRAISARDAAVVEKEFITNEILIENKFGLENRLPKIDPALVDLWRGANQALISANPDKVRHFSTSIRELITHVVHRLSPDKKLREWTSDPDHFQKGRPTREARLLYISRKINIGGFQKFVEKDVSATIEFLNLFHEGTHAVKLSLTEKQLLALKARTESTLNFLIDIGLEDA